MVPPLEFSTGQEKSLQLKLRIHTLPNKIIAKKCRKIKLKVERIVKAEKQFAKGPIVSKNLSLCEFSIYMRTGPLREII